MGSGVELPRYHGKPVKTKEACVWTWYFAHMNEFYGSLPDVTKNGYSLPDRDMMSGYSYFYMYTLLRLNPDVHDWFVQLSEEIYSEVGEEINGEDSLAMFLSGRVTVTPVSIDE